MWTDNCTTVKHTHCRTVCSICCSKMICICMPRHICFETKLYFSSNKILFNLEGDKSNRSRSFFLGKGDTADKTTFSAGKLEYNVFLEIRMSWKLLCLASWKLECLASWNLECLASKRHFGAILALQQPHCIHHRWRYISSVKLSRELQLFAGYNLTIVVQTFKTSQTFNSRELYLFAGII